MSIVEYSHAKDSMPMKFGAVNLCCSDGINDTAETVQATSLVDSHPFSQFQPKASLGLHQVGRFDPTLLTTGFTYARPHDISLVYICILSISCYVNCLIQFQIVNRVW